MRSFGANMDSDMTLNKNRPIHTKKRKTKGSKREAVVGTVMASVPLVGFIIFGLIPLVLALRMAFFEIDGYEIFDGEFVGFQNFSDVFNDPTFWKALLNTVKLGSSAIISQVFALGIAYLLSKNPKGKKAFRIIFFIPYVCSVVAITLMWKNMFNTNYGIINVILGRTGDNAIDWMGDSKYFTWAVIIMSVWSGMGFGIILYTAAFTNVNKSMVEAAKIDGANEFRIFFKVVLPSISSTSFYLLVMGIIGALQAFAVTNVLSPAGGPNGDGVTAVFWLYRRVIEYDNLLGVASAGAWILAMLIMIITAAQFVLSKKWVNYD